MEKFKVWVITSGDRQFATNNVESDTIEDAQAKAEDLYSRWFAVERWAVLSTETATGGYLSPDVVAEFALVKGGSW